MRFLDQDVPGIRKKYIEENVKNFSNSWDFGTAESFVKNWTVEGCEYRGDNLTDNDPIKSDGDASEIQKSQRNLVSVVGFFNDTNGLSEDAKTTFEAVNALNMQALKKEDIASAFFINKNKRRDLDHIRVICSTAQQLYDTFIYRSSDILNSYNIGVVPWEFDKLPSSLAHCLNMYDEIWAPSMFLKML